MHHVYTFLVFTFLSLFTFSQSYNLTRPKAVEYNGYQHSNFTKIKLVESLNTCNPQGGTCRTPQYLSNELEIYSKRKKIDSYTDINDSSYFNIIENVSSFYPLILDSIYFNDTGLLSYICYHPNPPDSICEYFTPIITDSYFDEDHTLHMVGYTYGSNYANDNGSEWAVNKEFYLSIKTRLQHDTTSNNPERMVRTGYNLEYKILQTIDPSLLNFERSVSIIPLKDNNSLVIYKTDTLINTVPASILNMIKIDSNNVVTSVKRYSNINSFQHIETGNRIFIYGDSLFELDNTGNNLPYSQIGTSYFDDLAKYFNIKRGYSLSYDSYASDTMFTYFSLDTAGNVIDSVRLKLYCKRNLPLQRQ